MWVVETNLLCEMLMNVCAVLDWIHVFCFFFVCYKYLMLQREKNFQKCPKGCCLFLISLALFNIWGILT